MRFLKISSLLILNVLISGVIQASLIRSQDSQTAESTPIVPNCAAQSEATPTVDATTEPEVTAEATVIAAQTSDVPIHFNTFLPTDVKFNPDTKNPVVVIMVFSLVFENPSNQTVELRVPKFKLAIEGVDWGDIASTDFQMGQLRAHGTQGIVLQSLTFVNKTTDAQKTVLDCIEHERPVELSLSGTMQAIVEGKEQTIDVDLTTPDVIIQARKAQS